MHNTQHNTTASNQQMQSAKPTCRKHNNIRGWSWFLHLDVTI